MRTARINPTFGRRRNIRILTLVLNLFFHAHNAFSQRRRRSNRLKGGTRRRPLLRRIVILRNRQIFLQAFKICRIYGIRKPVGIITRISHTGEQFAGFNVNHNAACRTGIQRKLGGRYLNVLYFLFQEIKGVKAAVGKRCLLPVFILENSLFKQNLADLIAGNQVVPNHILVNLLRKFRICL